MYRYLVLVTLMAAWIVLALFNPTFLPKYAQEQQPAAQPPELRRLAGELHFAGTPYWDGQTLTMALNIVEVDPVEHKAVGSVTWISVNDQVDEPAVQRIEATAMHVFLGADAPYGDPASAVVVAQVLAVEGNAVAQRGDYVYFWLRPGDGERPAQWGIFPYSVEPRIDFFPYDRSPAALGYFDVGALQITDPWAPLTTESGSIVLARSVIQ